VTRLVVNGCEHVVEVEPGAVLLDVLRDSLELRGAKYGCGEGECGACTVLVDDEAVRSCMVSVDRVGGGRVVTVEGISPDGQLHPVQAAFVEARAMQCGYCTPGMVMSVVGLLGRDPSPDDATIRTALGGNICRCGGYPRIVEAVHAAAATMGPGGSGSGVMADRTPSLGAVMGAADATGVAARSRPTDIGDSADEAATDGSGWTARLRLGEGQTRSWGWSTPGGVSLTIGVDGRVVAATGKVDGGQGNRNALTRLVCAELALPTSAVRMQMGDTALTPFDLGTFGSRSVPDAGHALRLVAAAMRSALIAAAAGEWGADPEQMLAVDGVVYERSTGRALSYGALVAAGSRTIEVDADMPLPPAPPGLSDVDDESLRRALTAAVTGAKQFPSDLTLPGMWHGVTLRPPAHGAVLQSVDMSAVRERPDVTVAVTEDTVSLAAPTLGAARAALGLVRAGWQTTAQPSPGELAEYLRAHPVAGGHHWEGSTGREVGDVDAASTRADVCLAATYTTAYIPHVPMEPRAALARWDGAALTVWVGTQRPFAVRSAVAAAVGLDETVVRVIVPDFGGGFGGKHTPDVAVEAARLAHACGHPVSVRWTREEEFSWAYLRPAAVIDVRAAGRDGALVAWDFTNINSGAAALASPYAVANLRERYQPADSPLPQGSYRALAATANTFARESHVDGLAAALSVDPVEFRLRHLTDARLAHALSTLAERIDWSRRARPPGYGLGIACGIEKDTRVATAAEVAVDPGGTLHVLRVVTCVDCGAIVDPTGLRNQIIGATIMGLGGALFERAAFDGGRISTASFSSYRVPRFTDVPPIEVILIDEPTYASAGAGETPIIAVAPAIANAVFAATGRRLRDLPLAPDNLVR
jgi:isoquinoline 1-oxidoreductase